MRGAGEGYFHLVAPSPCHLRTPLTPALSPDYRGEGASGLADQGRRIGGVALVVGPGIQPAGRVAVVQPWYC